MFLYGGLFYWLSTSGGEDDTAIQMAERIPMGQAVILSEDKAPSTDSGAPENGDQKNGVNNGGEDTTQHTTNTQDQGDNGNEKGPEQHQDTPQNTTQHTASSGTGKHGQGSIREYLKKPAYSTEVKALPTDPESGMMESTSDGILPMIARDGRTPMQVYARPFDDRDPRPRIAIVLTGIGLNSAVSTTAVKELPGEISLAVSPYADKAQNWVNRARSRGHEVLMHIPMEPDTYPADDPGPHTLLTGIDDTVNLDRLHWVMAQATGYAGVVNFMGTRFTENQKQLQPVLEEVKKRGLFFLDNNTANDSQIMTVAARIGAPLSVNSVVIDDIPTEESIDDMLAEVTRIAQRDGQVVAMAAAYPITLKRLKEWVETLQSRGYVLVPVSATVAKAEQMEFKAPGN